MGMTPHIHRTAVTRRTPLVEWVLQRESRAITCQLDFRSRGSYELRAAALGSIVGSIERFDTPTPALLRHAQLACRLRDAGWMVIDHVAATRVHAA